MSVLPKLPPRSMPSLTRIADYWMSDQHADVFPNLESRAVGWGEPFCFRCGWLAPVPGEEVVPDEKVAKDPWKYAAGWLERAHLAERFSGGSDKPDNIVPMCSICHRQMPDLIDTREAAIDWINKWDSDSRNPFWQLATDLTWGGDYYCPCPGTKDVLDLRLRTDDYHRRAVIEARHYARSLRAA